MPILRRIRRATLPWSRSAPTRWRFRLELRETQLDNGLTVMAECNDEAHTCSVGFFVRTGARDETPEVAGVSHFLEHMVFKGTPQRTADDVNREFDEMGAHYNAYTSEESTVYFAAILPEHQDRVVDLWADVLRPSLREDDFDMEKNVIIEEIRMYDDQPPYGADDRCKAAFFAAHPLANSVIGTVESVSNLAVDQMRSYFEERYSPGNIALVGSGKIDFDQLVRKAEEVCGGWQPFETRRNLPRVEPCQEFVTLTKTESTQEYAMEFALAPGSNAEERYAAKVLSVALGDDSGSRLFWDLVDPGLAENASLGHYEYDDAGLFVTYMACAPEACRDNLQRILDLYRQAAVEGIRPSEIDQAKAKITSRVVIASERPRSRLFNVGGSWLHGRPYRSVREDLDALAAVTVDDVARVMEQFPLTRNTTIAVGPLDDVAAPE
ncbi:MAG: insulinase family protein [Planctomycetota bacterium]|nr:MAG: insulinase family protein [Planctomycetota bacterium]REK40490.1 MAG: insulinase family protein [Planctomycetota bacterium]